MSRPDLRIIFYRGNSYPRSISINPKQLTRTLFFLAFMVLVGTGIFGLLLKAFVTHKVQNGANTSAFNPVSGDSYGPLNSADEQSTKLRDDVEQLQAMLKNAQIEKEAAQSIDTSHPVLGLFPPTVSDQTKAQPQVIAKSFTFSKGSAREPTSLSFELHNSEPGRNIQKGYIVVIARTKNAIYSYPNVFTNKGPYLIDFERGESFQVSRFRIVNAQFDQVDPLRDPVSRYQVLIFRRNGELLLNLFTEVTSK